MCSASRGKAIAARSGSFGSCYPCHRQGQILGTSQLGFEEHCHIGGMDMDDIDGNGIGVGVSVGVGVDTLDGF